MEKRLKLLIRRTSRLGGLESKGDTWQEFLVSVPENAYVLDAVEAAWLQDSSLLYRHSCHHASCGSCGMRIQGRERLACITPVFEAARFGTLRLEPLRNFPIIADLVVDISDLAHKLENVGAYVLTQISTGQVRFENCIECGLCISACPVAASNDAYLGPAVLAAAAKNMNEFQISSQVKGENGIWRCHSAFECTEVCPAGVEPASAIMNLRKDILHAMFSRKG